MKRIFTFIAKNPKIFIAAAFIAATAGVHIWNNLPVDVFPDVSVPRVTVHTEAGGLTAEEVEQLVTIPVESVVNGIPGVTAIRSSSSGGLSFVWIDFDWNADLSKARFDVFERLSRIRDTLPEEAHAEISPVVSITGEIMLIALTCDKDDPDLLLTREIAEYDLRTRILSTPGVGEVTVMGGKLPEFRIAADPVRLLQSGVTLNDVISAAKDTRTYSSGGYLADSKGEEIPIRQIARADTLETLKNSPVPLADGTSLKLGDIADIVVAGVPRRGSASFNGKNAVVLSVQKTPGGNTLKLTCEIEKILEDFKNSIKNRGIEIHCEAYRQADFINASLDGAKSVFRDAVLIVTAVLLLTLLNVRTIVTVLCTLPISILLGITIFPLLGIGINVMTIGGFAVAAGDIVDAAIIFTEVIRRRLRENAALEPSERKPTPDVVAKAARSVAGGVLFSTLIVAMTFAPILLLGGLEGRFFKPLALSYICIFAMSLVAAWFLVPALSTVLSGNRKSHLSCEKESLPSVMLKKCYAPILAFALKFPKTVLLAGVAAAVSAVVVASGFGSSFLPPFKEDSFNVMISLPPGTSLSETERLSQSCVPLIRSIPGVKSVTRRTGRAERDQHAEPVSSSEFVVRVDMKKDTSAVRDEIRARLGSIPGAALIVGYPIAHRISAVLSGTEAELAINIFGDDVDTLRKSASRVKEILEKTHEVKDVRANREITMKSYRIDYLPEALYEAGITPKEIGEQVSCAFNGTVAGEVRNGIRKRNVTVRLAGDENGFDLETIRSLYISSRAGKRVRLDEVSSITKEDASNLLLREKGLRKALISCNPAPGVDTGKLVKKLREILSAEIASSGLLFSFGGSYQARESAGKQMAFLGTILIGAIFFVLVLALKSAKRAALAMINIPQGLIGATAAVWIFDPVVSVPSLVGLITVTGFVLRNSILLIDSCVEKSLHTSSLDDAITTGTQERMIPIVTTSLTTLIGLIPLMGARSTPGGELLAPLAAVQFGGILSAMILNLIVLPSAIKTFGLGKEDEK